MSRTTEISAGIIPFRVTDDDQLEILTVKARTDDWEFPKGGVEGSEELQQTALREAKEELNVSDIRIIDGFSTSYSYSFYWEGDPVDKTVHLYLAELFNPSVNLSDEHSAYKWLPPEDALDQVTHDGMVNALEDGLEHLKEQDVYPSELLA